MPHRLGAIAKVMERIEASTSSSSPDPRRTTAAATAGSFVVNQPGTRHRVVSPEGCLVLVVWERPVRFELAEDGPADS